jgi:hypothetical protein
MVNSEWCMFLQMSLRFDADCAGSQRHLLNLLERMLNRNTKPFATLRAGCCTLMNTCPRQGIGAVKECDRFVALLHGASCDADAEGCTEW